LQLGEKLRRDVGGAGVGRQPALREQLAHPVESQADGEHEGFPDPLAFDRHRFHERQPFDAERFAHRGERQRVRPVALVGLHDDPRVRRRLCREESLQLAQVRRGGGQVLRRAVEHEDDGVRLGQQSVPPRGELLLARHAEDLTVDGAAVEVATGVLQPVEIQRVAVRLRR
jgi:hypothetical protein